MATWNPWHGCRKISPGCLHCYVYRRDLEFGRDSSRTDKTTAFDLPVKRNRKGDFKLQPDGDFIYTCLTSDFFLEEADEWRSEAWSMMRIRSDLQFYIITKRIDRFSVGLPPDWGDGYENVTVCCTCENQERTDYRLPIFLELPIRHREVIHEPMLEAVDIDRFLKQGKIEKVTCGGESGPDARLCDYTWVLGSREQCVRNQTAFYFKQTGANFKKGNKVYQIGRTDQMSQAAKAGINVNVRGKG